MPRPQPSDPGSPRSGLELGANRRLSRRRPWPASIIRRTTRRRTMRRTLGINVLQCPVCQATMPLLAVITRREVIDRILTHVKVRREPIEWTRPPTSAGHWTTTSWSILRLRRCERELPRSVPLRSSRPRRGSSEGRLRGVIPAVRALIGPERGLEAGWLGDLRRLRPLHARGHLRFPSRCPLSGRSPAERTTWPLPCLRRGACLSPRSPACRGIWWK